MSVYLALYKKKTKVNSLKSLNYRLLDELIRLITRSKYSHCELVVKLSKRDEYKCYSSSFRDGGVRMKIMKLSSDDWDLVPVNITKRRVEYFFNKTRDMKYDLLGALGTVMSNRDESNKFFCSEWCAKCLRLEDSEKYTPGKLHSKIVSTMSL